MMDIVRIIDGEVDTVYRDAVLENFSGLGGQYVEAPAGEVFAGFAYDGLTFSPPAVSFENLRAAKLAALADRRWQAETGGVDFNGSIIRSDATSQAKITGAVSLFASDPTLTVIDWEATPGEWVQLDASTMTAIGVAVGRHVQACFSNAKTLSQGILAAADQAALDAVDMEVGWPT